MDHVFIARKEPLYLKNIHHLFKIIPLDNDFYPQLKRLNNFLSYYLNRHVSEDTHTEKLYVDLVEEDFD